MNNARLMSLLSEATDGAQYVSRRPKRKDDKEGYESDPLTKKMADVHKIDVTTEDEYPTILKHSKKTKQSRVGYDHGKNGDKSPNTIDPKYGKMGGHGSSTERPIDKKKINERLFSIIKRTVNEGKWNYPSDQTSKTNKSDDSYLGGAISGRKKADRKEHRKKVKADAHKKLMNNEESLAQSMDRVDKQNRIAKRQIKKAALKSKNKDRSTLRLSPKMNEGSAEPAGGSTNSRTASRRVRSLNRIHGVAAGEGERRAYRRRKAMYSDG